MIGVLTGPNAGAEPWTARVFAPRTTSFFEGLAMALPVFWPTPSSGNVGHPTS